MRTLSLLLVLLVGCDSGFPSVDDLSQDATLLTGTWELVETWPYWGGENGPIRYEGPRWTAEFRSDGTFAENTSGEIWLEGPYEVSGSSIDVIRESGLRRWLGQFGVSSSELVLDTRAIDGDARYYRRVE